MQYNSSWPEEEVSLKQFSTTDFVYWSIYFYDANNYDIAKELLSGNQSRSIQPIKNGEIK